MKIGRPKQKKYNSPPYWIELEIVKRIHAGILEYRVSLSNWKSGTEADGVDNRTKFMPAVCDLSAAFTNWKLIVRCV